MNEELIAPCGMNCALCVSYQFGQGDLNKQGFNRRYCPGCRPRGKNCTFMAQHCKRLRKGTVRYCYLCPAFPCKRLKDLDKRYSTKYGMSMIDNLRYIKEHGIEAFLLKEQDKWKCPSCGATICCHSHSCLSCDIASLRNSKHR